jgi:hypothetical protein
MFCATMLAWSGWWLALLLPAPLLQAFLNDHAA